MKNMIKDFCTLPGASGREENVRNAILDLIKPYADVTVDPLGNIIAFKKGEITPKKKVMLDAHMDEVALIITAIDDNGFLKFQTVGGIDTAVLISKTVKVGSVSGVIGSKPVHLCKSNEKEKMPSVEDLYIDIGAENKAEAECYVSLGDVAIFDTKFTLLGDLILSKALDDRAGCAILVDLIRQPSQYDFYATFTVQEEVGLRGARTAAYTVDPDYAIVLESTTAADLSNVPSDKKVCKVGNGAVVSFMDGSTMYDRRLFEDCLETARINNIPVQVKSATSGGNNAGAIHLSRNGVKTLALSVPCRYIHSPSSVADINDIYAVRDLAKEMLLSLANGELE